MDIIDILICFLDLLIKAFLLFIMMDVMDLVYTKYTLKEKSFGQGIYIVFITLINYAFYISNERLNMNSYIYIILLLVSLATMYIINKPIKRKIFNSFEEKK